MKLKATTLAAALLMSHNAAAGLNPTSSFDVTIRLAGASAVDNLIFDSVLKDICKSDISVLNKPGTSSLPHKLGNYFGVACTAKTQGDDPDIDSALAGKKLLFIKRSEGGSAFGANTLLEDPPRPIAQIDPSTCTADTTGPYTSAIPSVGTVDAYKCSNTTTGAHVAQDFGLSDVNPEMFKGANKPVGFSDVAASQVAAKFGAVKGVAAQVFGIVVTTGLRNALQTAQFGATSNCIGNESEDCMPSLSKSLVLSLLSGKVNDWSTVSVNGTPLTTVAGVADTAVKVCRRTPGSGTQATINNVIMGLPCSSGGTAPATGNTPNITQGSGSSDVANCLTAWNTGTSKEISTDLGTGKVTVNAAGQVGWALGPQGLEKADPNFRFVKLDGVAPTAKNAHDGKYAMWSELTIQYRIDGANALSGGKLGFVNTLKNTIGRASNLKDLNALMPTPAYLALSTQSGQVPDAVWKVENPVIGFTHTTVNTDNCRTPGMNPTYNDRTPLGF